MIPPAVAAIPLEPNDKPAATPERKPARKPARRRRRRAATAMEYLVALSFILVALIIGVQHFAAATNKLFSNSANATANTVQPP